MEHTIETGTESWFSALRPLDTQAQSVAGRRVQPPCGRMLARVDRHSEP